MKTLTLYLSVIGIFCYAIASWLDMPVVVKSWETNKCVAVYSPDNNYTCGKLPEMYDVKWVR